MVKSDRSCTEYWLDTQTGSFRGEFDAMYKNIADPWDCEARKASVNNKIFIELVFDTAVHFPRVVDVGCGLGGLLDAIRSRNGGGEVLGIDISPTAIAKATLRYPEIRFESRDIVASPVNEPPFNLVVLSEVRYGLEDLETFFERITKVVDADGILAIHQYFPFEQKYGKERIDGLQGFLRFLQDKTEFRSQSMVTSHHVDGHVLLATFKRKIDARI